MAALASVGASDRGRRSWIDYVKLITVEPSMFFYIMAFMVTSVVEQAFFVYKACKVDLGFPEYICRNLTAHETENKKVQIVVSTFHQYNDIASQAIPIVLALFIGAWSDRRGRKLLLLMGLVGKLWYSVWIVINSLQETWTVDVIVWTASLPSGLTGADLSIFAASFSYLSDITTLADRTVRITILDITYLASMPIGIAIGKVLFDVVDGSYTIMFIINACLLVVAVIYTLIRLDWATTPQQRPLPLCCINVNPMRPGSEGNLEGGEREEALKGTEDKCCLLDFFDFDHLVESLRTLFRTRPNHGRSFLWIIIFSMALYTFQRDERQMSYLYTQLKFHWDVKAFSDFRTFQSGMYVVGTLLCLPLMGRLLKLSDMTIVMVGTTAHATARVLYALTEVPTLFYVGAAISSLGPVVAPILRSMASKIVPQRERGKVFALLSVADTAVPLFSGIVYTQVYNGTLHTSPNSIYWVTVSTQLTVFLFALLITFMTGGRALEECAQERRPQL